MKKEILWIIAIIVIIVGIVIFYKSNNRPMMKSANDSNSIQAEIDSSVNSELEVDEKVNNLENRTFE